MTQNSQAAPLPAVASGGAARGGWRPWLIWGLAASLFCYGFFQRVAPSVMIDHLMRDMAVGGALLGNLSAFYFYAYAGLQIPVGIMADRWGPRRLLTFGAALCGLGSLLFAWADSLTLAYLGRLLVGAGAGFGFVSTLKLATHWFPSERFAQMAGLTMMLGMAGGVGGQAPLATLVESYGWRPTMAWSGLFGICLALVIWSAVRDRPEGEAEPQAPGPLPQTALLTGLAAALRSPRNLLLAFVGASMTAPLLGFAGLWGVSWLMQTRGMARPEAAGTTSLVLIGWAIGGPLIGALSDRIGRRKGPLLAGNLLGLAGLAGLLYLPGLNTVALGALYLIMGIGLGGMVVAFAATRESNPLESAGVAYAVVNCAVVASGAVFQPLIGGLLDWAWDGTLLEGVRVYSAQAYRLAFSSMVIFLLLGFFAGLAIKETHPRAMAHP